MRDSSYNFHTQTQQIFSRGGEKKVMKKSLSILLSFALVFGLFASMASAADTELTVAQKYQALVDKGVLKGNPDGDARLDANLNRAEFATIAIAISGLAPEKPATATFSDVNSKQWWYGAIEAAAKAGLVEGYNGKFDPKANVTVEQVIKVAVQAADLKIDEKAEAVEGASAWAAPYIKAALDAGLIATGLDYKADATRGQTILVGYSVYEKLNQVEPAKVSISAKAAGIKKVEVTFDKAVDTEKATLTLKKGSQTVELDKTVWSEDKKVATLPLKSVKITAGTYSVTLGGLDAATVEKGTAEFTAENETVTKIDFVTTSDEIAQSTKAKIKLKSENQYGELASFSAASYTANTPTIASGSRIAKDDEGYLIVTLDSKTGQITGINKIPVIVYFNDNRVKAEKTFTVGIPPIVSGLEIGEVKYSNTNGALSVTGDTAVVPLKFYDQYGNPVTPEIKTADALNINITEFILPHTDAIVADHTDESDDSFKIKLSIPANKKVEKTAKHTLTVYAGTSTKTAEINLVASKIANKVIVNEPASVIAAGDTTAYFPLEVYDADNNLLTAQEIVDNYEQGRLKVTSTVGSPAEIVLYGKQKGKVKVGPFPATSAKSYVNVTAQVSALTGGFYDYNNRNVQIQDKRIPDRIVVDGTPKAKAVLGADTEFGFAVKDQYNDTITTAVAPEKNYRVVVSQVNTAGVTTAVYGKSGNTGVVVAGAAGEEYDLNNATLGFDKLYKGFTFDTTADQSGVARVTAALQVEGATAGTFVDINKITVSTETIKNDAALTYTIKDLGELYAAKDNAIFFTNAQLPATGAALVNKVAKQVGVVVKDASGAEVAFPGDRVYHVQSSNPNVVEVAVTSATGGQGYVLGNKAGTAVVTAYVNAADGSSKALSSNVTVKNDLVKVTSIGAEEEITVANAIADLFTNAALKTTDQYGVTIEKLDIAAYDALLGLRYAVSNIKATGAANTVSVTPAGAVTVGADVQEFTLTVLSRDGEASATILVKR